MFEDGHAGEMDAAMQQRCQAFDGDCFRWRGAFFGAVGIRLGSLQPEQNDLPEETFFDVAERDRLVQIAFRQFFRDERYGQARVLQ